MKIISHLDNCPDCKEGTLYGKDLGDGFIEIRCTNCSIIRVRPCRRKEDKAVDLDRRIFKNYGSGV